MRGLALIVLFLSLSLGVAARNVTVHASGRPAADVFRSIVAQTGMNFVYSSDLLRDVSVTVDADNQPLKKVLSTMFRNTDIAFRIKGDNIVLKRRSKPRQTAAKPGMAEKDRVVEAPDSVVPTELAEIVVVSRLEAPVVETAEIGAKKISASDIAGNPVLLGESDVVKTLQTLPGVTEGMEGLAGMYVHGGNADENLCMLDNVPLYQTNHFAGLFSAFNTDIVRYIDFFKTSVPAKYDGRLSSFMDVRLKNGSREGHHGSARLGLTSGTFNISGPIGERTTYLAGLRRSWFDVLTVPVVAIANSGDSSTKTRFRYRFVDLNAKISHRFSPSLNGFVSAYYGNDLLKTGSEDKTDESSVWQESEKYDFDWGNLVVQAGLNYKIAPKLTSEFTAAYTRYLSRMKYDDRSVENYSSDTTVTRSILKTENNINDWIFRGDFDWIPSQESHVRFGVSCTLHSFLPGRTMREYSFNNSITTARDSVAPYGANEINAYIEDDWKITGSLTANAGLHASLFHIDGHTLTGLSPRLSVGYRISGSVAAKAAYTRTVQYVHQLVRSYLSLPTDQWIPVSGGFKPETADKVAAGVYWMSDDAGFSASVEGYCKWMHNLVDYTDEYYLKPPMETWNARLTAGRGLARGVDFALEKNSGRLTGRISYSLAWSDRTFPDKNGGRTFPARFDNRHTVNIIANWRINDRISLNASWTGHSGNRFTLLSQVWTPPGFGGEYIDPGEGVPLRSGINSYQLPFYHRLDLSCTVRNKHGEWAFGLYNAYCHLNTIGVRMHHREVRESTPDGIRVCYKPVFQRVRLLPIIPSISYTWRF